MEPVVKPADCALLVALPLSHEEFWRQFADSDHHHFSQHVAMTLGSPRVCDAWTSYRRDVVLIEHAARELAGLGGSVETSATLEHWQRAFATRKVVALLAHAPDPEHIELGDRIVSTAELTAAAPAGFAGVIDLMSCFSLPLALALKERCRSRPDGDCVVIGNQHAAMVSARVFRFICTIRLLHRRADRYSHANYDVAKELIHRL